MKHWIKGREVYNKIRKCGSGGCQAVVTVGSPVSLVRVASLALSWASLILLRSALYCEMVEQNNFVAPYIYKQSLAPFTINFIEFYQGNSPMHPSVPLILHCILFSTPFNHLEEAYFNFFPFSAPNFYNANKTLHPLTLHIRVGRSGMFFHKVLNFTNAW